MIKTALYLVIAITLLYVGYGTYKAGREVIESNQASMIKSVGY